MFIIKNLKNIVKNKEGYKDPLNSHYPKITTDNI